MGNNDYHGGIRNLQWCLTPGITVVYGSKQRLHIHLLKKIILKRKQPCLDVSAVGSVVVVAVQFSCPPEPWGGAYFSGGVGRRGSSEIL